jgi:hypothetical protein
MNLETVTGKLVNVVAPDPASICIDDIAWGLSRTPRFCGHTVTEIPYTVAQHSVFVANRVKLMNKFDSTEEAGMMLLALLHDAAEAYTGDWPSPIKRIPELRPHIKALEGRLMDAIYIALEISPPTMEEEMMVKEADRFAQKIEANEFMPSRGRDWPDLPKVSLEELQKFEPPLPSLAAYKLFMKTFNELTTKINTA